MVLARASVQELWLFVSRSKALRLVSSLRMGAVALREERQSLTVDSPLAIADLCSEMRFLDRESLRVVLLNAKQHLIKVCTVSQGTVNESLTHPREIFKPVITHSAYSFIMVHNHPSGDPSPSEADLRLTRRINEVTPRKLAAARRGIQKEKDRSRCFRNSASVRMNIGSNTRS
jgi:DNA repair protein RadC